MNDMENKLAIVAEAAGKIIGMKVVAKGVYGSVMRGYADPNSGIDVVLLVERPLSDYLNITHNEMFKDNPEERRIAFIELSKKVTESCGISAMVSIVDMKDLLVGIVNNNLFSLCAYEYFVRDNDIVKQLYADVVSDHDHTPSKVWKLGQSIKTAITHYATQSHNWDSSQAYLKERSFLNVYWQIQRLLAYVSGDSVNVRTLEELVKNNKEKWQLLVPNAFDPCLMAVYKARVGRNHFDYPGSIPTTTSNLLVEAANNVLVISSDYIRKNPTRSFNGSKLAIELIDLYNGILDIRENKKE